jgi:hypothetical protein
MSARTHDRASFVWDGGACQRARSKELYVQKYAAHLRILPSPPGRDDDDNDVVDRGDSSSGGRNTIASAAAAAAAACPEDIDNYLLLDHIQRRGTDVNRNATTVVTGLRPSTPYCLRIEAFSIRGLSLGVRVLPFETKPEPINEWLPVMVRQRDVSTMQEARATIDEGDGPTTATATETLTTWCEHSSARPSGRRGHSMTVINDQVYIFGGATMKCVCEMQVVDREGRRRVCSRKNVYSNELWHFDPLTSMFAQVGWESEAKEEEEEEGGGPWPRGREQHSVSALPNGYLVLVGGVSSSNDDFEIAEEAILLLNDVWTMRDPHRVFPNMVFSSGSNAVDLKAGHVTSHVMPISLRDKVVSVGEEEMCMQNSSQIFTRSHLRKRYPVHQVDRTWNSNPRSGRPRCTTK